MDKQRIELIGRVVVKPELQTSKEDKPYTKIRIAVNDKPKKDSEEESEVTYYDLLTFDKRAELSTKLDKGLLVRVLGDLKATAYLSKQGEPKNDLTVFVKELHVFDTNIFKTK
jgi:single-stranded DNA-binding protein